jgi:hypothetical protein
MRAVLALALVLARTSSRMQGWLVDPGAAGQSAARAIPRRSTVTMVREASRV